jgi:predicted HAD superfamily Cof-like phosphohydrolase
LTVVREFHEAFGLPAADYPSVPDLPTLQLRMRLIDEEYREARAELVKLMRPQRIEAQVTILRALLKELADLRYVVEGTAVSLGLPIDAAYSEVHRSNMSKLGADGKPIYREDGKVLKGPAYTEADMAQFIPLIEED